MNSTITILAFLVIGVPVASGCGAATPAQTPTQAEPVSGGQVAAPPAPEPVAVSEAVQAPAPGPATLVVDVIVHGKPVPAGVRLTDADGQDVATGKSAEQIALQSGEYTLQVQITDEAVLLDKPTQTRTVTLQPGEALSQKVEFPWAMIQLNVRINGNLDANAEVHLGRNGEPVAVLKSGAPNVPISPGRYAAEVKTKGTTTKIDGLMFPEGATQSVPVNLQL